MTTCAEQEKRQPNELSGKYLTFFLGDEEYAVHILQVQEIIRAMSATPMPGMPSHVLGVINLRGKVIPVFDLRRRFDLPDTERSAKTCIIVVHVHGRTTGIVVDCVSEVVHIHADVIEPATALASDIDTEYLLGIANCEDGLKILLALENVLPRKDLDAMSA